MGRTGENTIVLGFLTVRPTTTGGRRGGYLLTTQYGRPIEFHYTSEVRLVGPQKLLYGTSFTGPTDVELFALPLVDRQFAPPQMLFVDSLDLIELRREIPAPVAAVLDSLGAGPSAWRAVVHPLHAADAADFAELERHCPPNFDFHEPFERLSAALGELRDTRAAA